MKNLVTRFLSVGIALAAVATVQAQDKTVTANVPFRFYMGSNAMPQGAYRIGEVSSGAIMWLTSEQGATKATTTFSVMGTKKEEPARLVFHCYSGNCFLAEIWTGDSSTGRALGASPRERELAHGTAPVLAEIRLALR